MQTVWSWRYLLHAHVWINTWSIRERETPQYIHIESCRYGNPTMCRLFSWGIGGPVYLYSNVVNPIQKKHPPVITFLWVVTIPSHGRFMALSCRVSGFAVPRPCGCIRRLHFWHGVLWRFGGTKGPYRWWVLWWKPWYKQAIMGNNGDIVGGVSSIIWYLWMCLKTQ